jgi:hypothetical protein
MDEPPLTIGATAPESAPSGALSFPLWMGARFHLTASRVVKGMSTKDKAETIIRSLISKDDRLTFEVYSGLRKRMGRWATPWKVSTPDNGLGTVYVRYSVKSGKVCASVKPMPPPIDGEAIWVAKVNINGKSKTGPMTELLYWAEEQLVSEGWTPLPGIVAAESSDAE